MAQKYPFPQRKKTYEEALAEVDKICDGLGKSVDSGIKPLVAALWMFGVETTSSCHGHHNKLPFPCVDIDYTSAYTAGRLVCMANPGTFVPVWVFEPFASWLRLMPRDTSKPLRTLRKQARVLAKIIQHM